VEAINRVRFERFDRVLQQVLLESGDSPPPVEKNSIKGSEMSILHDWVSYNLGQWYRYSHGANPTSKVEDMSAILQAYWRVTSKRVCDNVCMLLESNLLSAVPNTLETKLLTHTQCLDQESLLRALQEETGIVERRMLLENRRNRIKLALESISKVAPGMVATSRRQGMGETTSKQSTGDSSYSDNFTRNGNVETVVVSKSEPEKKAAAANDGSVAHFIYKGDGDNGGLIYWLGTAKHTTRFRNPHDRGLIAITSSGMAIGTESTLVSRKRVQCMTSPSKDSWISLDIGARKSFAPTHISLCNGSSSPGADLINWVIEGYDEAIRMWVILRRSSGPNALPSPHGAATWEIEGAGERSQKGYRFLRLRSTGSNESASTGLPICALELYGRLFSPLEGF